MKVTLAFLAAIVCGLALGVPARADIAMRYSWSGPVFMTTSGYSMNTTYNGTVNDGSGAYVPAYDASGGKWFNPVSGVYDLPDSPSYPAASLGSRTAGSSKSGEDAWSVFQVQSVYTARVVGPETVSILDSTHPLWQTGDNNMELAGTIFGQSNISVRFTSTDFAGQELEFKGGTMNLFSQPLGTANIDQGGGGRIVSGGVAQDKYAGIGFDADGNPLAGAQLVVSASGAVGFYGADRATEGSTTISQYTGTSDDKVNWAVTGGSEAGFWHNNLFAPTKPGFSTCADIRMKMARDIVTPSGSFDWDSAVVLNTTTSFYEPVGLAGDANNDGLVDDNDLNILLSNWGTGTTREQGNFGGSGTVGDNDLNILLNNWGRSAPAAVPEPVTVTVMALGGLATLLQRRK